MTSGLNVILASSDTPTLVNDTYTISLSHPLTADGQAIGAFPATSRTVEVAGPRFALTPEDVVAVHPPPGSAGNLSLTLPHLVAKDPRLPWSRYRDPTGEKTPWVALLVLTADDAATDPQTGTLLTPRQAKDLTGTPPSGVLFPTLSGVTGTDTTTCQTVDVRAKALKATLPHHDELPYLVHQRSVKPETVAAASSGWEEGRYSVAVANRFPRTNGRQYTAVLVSLEGFGSYDFMGGGTSVSDDTWVRMIALWSWSFSHTGAAAPSFSSLAEDIRVGTTTENRLRLPRPDFGNSPTSLQKHVTARLEGGWVPTVHRLPTGEHIPAWYRGPFTALPAATLPSNHALTSADAALIYLKDYGVFDVGYAAAFTLGQFLALSNPALLKALDACRAQALDSLHHCLRDLDEAGAGNSAREQFAHLVATENLVGNVANGLKKKNPTTAKDQDTAADDATTPSSLGPGPSDPPPLGEVVAALADGVPPDADPRVRAVDRALVSAVEEHVEPLAAQLDDTTLLASVPLDHLVPHAGMLPWETVRFFRIDAQWLAAVRAGATSVGTVTSLDEALGARLGRRLQTEADGAAEPQAGMLLRSVLVREWPTLIVEAKDSNDKHMDMTIRHLLPEALLVLFPEVPKSVTLREPPQGLTVGIDGHNDSGKGILHLRRHKKGANQGEDPGTSLGKTVTGLDDCMRGTTAPASEVLRIYESPAENNLWKKVKDHISDDPTAASLALQLVNSSHALTVNAG